MYLSGSNFNPYTLAILCSSKNLPTHFRVNAILLLSIFAASLFLEPLLCYLASVLMRWYLSGISIQRDSRQARSITTLLSFFYCYLPRYMCHKGIKWWLGWHRAWAVFYFISTIRNIYMYISMHYAIYIIVLRYIYMYTRRRYVY